MFLRAAASGVGIGAPILAESPAHGDPEVHTRAGCRVNPAG